jgi:hypothetical protein
MENSHSAADIPIEGREKIILDLTLHPQGILSLAEL